MAVINWVHYMEDFQYGLQRHVLRDEVPSRPAPAPPSPPSPPPPPLLSFAPLFCSQVVPSQHLTDLNTLHALRALGGGGRPLRPLGSLFSDLGFALSHAPARHVPPAPAAQLASAVLASPRVAEAVKNSPHGAGLPASSTLYCV